MKKIYSILFCVLIGTQAFSQNTKSLKNIYTKNDYSLTKVKPTRHNNPSKSVALWSNDMSNASDWIITNTSVPSTIEWYHQDGSDLSTPAGAGNFASTTASNGFFMVNSDAVPGNTDGDNTPIVTDLTIASPIDLSGETYVTLEFQHNFRWWKDTRGVRVSGDGGNNWTEYELTNNTGYEDGDYYDGEQSSDNPHITTIDISAVAGNSSNVLVQFYYNDNDIWAWYWVVDDVVIRRLVPYDLKNEFAYAYGASTNFAEYGRTPLSQLDQEWVIGASVSNKGSQTLNNITLNADFGSFSSTSTYTGSLEKDSILNSLETIETLSLDVGLYQGTFTVFSDNDTQDGTEFSNNVLQRNFEITENVYSLDGLGNHPDGLEETESWLHSATNWTDGGPVHQGITPGTLFPILNQDTINSVTAILTNNTAMETAVSLYIVDTSEAFKSTWPNNSIYSTFYELTEEDVANKSITIPVDNGSGYLAINPGQYYVFIQLLGYDGLPIGIVDDITVAQPNISSITWFPEDELPFGAGNAWAIRLNLGPDMPMPNGIKENSDNISIYPNPSDGIVNVTFEKNENRTITVRDISGKVIKVKNINANTVINFNDYGKGVYTIEIVSNQKTIIKKLIIK